MDTHDELGQDVEHGEEHDWEVVGNEGGGGPVAFEEDFPGAELESQQGSRDSKYEGEAGRRDDRRGNVSQCDRYTRKQGTHTKRTNADEQTHHHPANGCTLEANGSVFLSMPCAFRPL